MDCMAWRFWTIRQSNGCSTPVPKSSAAKQWIKEKLAQEKKKTFKKLANGKVISCIVDVDVKQISDAQKEHFSE